MGLFVIGNILLQAKRNRLPRPEKANWLAIILAFTGVIVALVGNITMKPVQGVPINLSVFQYFIPDLIFIAIMLNITVLLKFLLRLMHSVFDPFRNLVHRIDKKILNIVEDINSQEFIYFTKETM